MLEVERVRQRTTARRSQPPAVAASADSVIRYLVERHNRIPLRRIITPYGFGETKPGGGQHVTRGAGAEPGVEV